MWDGEYMDKLSLKGKITAVAFAASFMIAAILFDFDQIAAALIFFLITVLFAIVLIIEHDKIDDK